MKNALPFVFLTTLTSIFPMVSREVLADVNESPTGYESEEATAQQLEAEQQAKKDDENKKCQPPDTKIDPTEVEPQSSVKEGCSPVDYASENPVSHSPAVATIGSDRSTGAYYSPEDPVLNGKKVSWAKLESFKQFMEEKGVPENATMAIAGNLQHESNAFSRNRWEYVEGKGHVLTTRYGSASRGDIMNGTYTSFGIAQYHKDRAISMMNSVGAADLSREELVRTTNKQYEYLYNDLKPQLDLGKTKVYSEFMNPNTSLDRATQIFVDKYEIPKAVAGERYGRMGGQDRFKNAVAMQTFLNQPVLALDTDGSNADKSKAKSSVKVDLPTISTNGSTAGLGTPLGITPSANVAASILMGNTAFTVPGGVATESLLTALLQQTLSGILSNSSSKSSSKDTEVKQATTTQTTTRSESSTVKVVDKAMGAEIQRGYDVLKALSEQCKRDLLANKDALMLIIKECQSAEG